MSDFVERLRAAIRDAEVPMTDELGRALDEAEGHISRLHKWLDNWKEATELSWKKEDASAAEISRLRAEVEALRKDAERWRTFLNTRPANTHEVICAAIDAAISPASRPSAES